jgi:hypothetical protein
MKYLILLITLCIILPKNNTLCTVTCMKPIKNNITMYCPNKMNAYIVCFSDIDYMAFCANSNYVFNITWPNIVSWTVCN